MHATFTVRPGEATRLKSVSAIGKREQSCSPEYACAYSLRLDELPVGKSKVALKIQASGRYRGIDRWKDQDVVKDVELDRKPIEPMLRGNYPKGCGTSEAVCVGSRELDEKGSVLIGLEGTPKSKVLIGDQQVTFGEYGKLELKLNLMSRLVDGRVHAVDAGASGTLSVPITITSVDGVSKNGTLEVPFEQAADAVLRSADKGPALFPGEPPTVGPAKVMVKYSEGATGRRYFGNGRVRDIELVAIVKHQRRTMPCGVYENSATGETKTASNTGVDADVAVYQRKTGKRVITKRFVATFPPCRAKISGTYLDDVRYAEGIDAWLKTLLVP